MYIDYYAKYLKYKNKYLELIGGFPKKLYKPVSKNL